MSGLKSTIRDLGQSFEKLKAMQGAEDRKRAAIKELSRDFVKQGYSPWMASNLAQEKYKQIHNDNS